MDGPGKGENGPSEVAHVSRYPMLINCLKNEKVKSRATPWHVEGRRVLAFVPYAGTYGMGGPGFFALQLEASEVRPAEWLVCTLWGADNWFVSEGRWLAAHPGQYEEQRPLRGSYKNYVVVESDEEWDEFTPRILGRPIKRFRCERQSCELVIGDLQLEITEDPATRPILYGNKKPRVLEQQDDLRDAWVLAEDIVIEI